MGLCRRTTDAGRRRTAVTGRDDGTAWRSATRLPPPDANTDRWLRWLRPGRGGDEDATRSRRRGPLDRVRAVAARCTAAENTAAGSRRRHRHRRSATLDERPNHRRRRSSTVHQGRRVESLPASPTRRMMRR